jgi:hypothetical protein
MACSHSIRSCPICKRQLKKEDFRELTSEVCSICQSKPKFPILTTSGSLSCWACHYKTQCDQGLEPSQVIPIYGTEEETEDVADPAVPPRPVLQPDDSATTVVESRSRGSDQSIVQIDESEDIVPILSMPNNFRHHHLFRCCTALMIIGLTIQLSSALTIYIIAGHLPPNWWYLTLGGNLLTLTSLTFLVMSVFCKCKTLSILSSLVYLITAGVMIFKFVIFAMDVDVDIENIPMDGMLEANTVELFGHLICGTAHLSVMFGRWKLF